MGGGGGGGGQRTYDTPAYWPGLGFIESNLSIIICLEENSCKLTLSKFDNSQSCNQKEQNPNRIDGAFNNRLTCSLTL